MSHHARDPLAGKRQAINEDRLETLVWPDDGKGAPVKRGDVFQLRTCHVEILRVRRVRRSNEFVWVADFQAIARDQDKPLYLARSGGTTDDPDLAMRAQEAKGWDPPEPDRTGVPHPVEGEPPEPEAVPDHEVAHLPSTAAAKARYEHEHEQQRIRRKKLTLEQRLSLLRCRAAQEHVDISGKMRAFERQIEDLERQLDPPKRRVA